ncbi:class I SAM-dependent methyltransferase [Serratia ureilytica]
MNGRTCCRPPAFCRPVDERLPKSLSDIARIAYARLFNRQSRKRAWQVGKEHYDIGNDLFRAMLDPTCNTPAVTGKRRRRSSRRSRPSCG